MTAGLSAPQISLCKRFAAVQKTHGKWTISVESLESDESGCFYRWDGGIGKADVPTNEMLEFMGAQDKEELNGSPDHISSILKLG